MDQQSTPNTHNINQSPEHNSQSGFENIDQYVNREVLPAPVPIERERTSETQSQASSDAQQAATTQPQIQVSNNQNPAVSAPPAHTGVNPTTAHDEDQIEQEWINRAKDIVRRTQGDPARRKEEVTELQKDYQMKRYGRKLGNPQD